MASPGATHSWGMRAGLARARGPVAKACPVVLQSGAVLAFRHPRAGCQLVKGGIERGETPGAAAARELREEAGTALRPDRPLGAARIAPRVAWHLVLMRAGPLPRQWQHWCADDGGHRLRFFWQPLARRPGRGWHPVHARALAAVRASLRAGMPRR